MRSGSPKLQTLFANAAGFSLRELIDRRESFTFQLNKGSSLKYSPSKEDGIRNFIKSVDHSRSSFFAFATKPSTFLDIDRSPNPTEDVEFETLEQTLNLDRRSHLKADTSKIQKLILSELSDAAFGTSVEEIAESLANSIKTKLENAISSILGRPISLKLDMRGAPSFRVCLNKTEFPFKYLPDGIRAVISSLLTPIASHWHLGATSPLDARSILIIDEPETHLHPKWQREFIPTVLTLLPNTQFFAATHSPFVISSANEGSVHILEFNAESKVFVKSLPLTSGDSYIDVVEDVLGVNEWFDGETETLLTKFRNQILATQELVAEMNSSVNSSQAHTEIQSKLAEIYSFADEIGKRGPMVNAIVTRELNQLKNQLKFMERDEKN